MKKDDVSLRRFIWLVRQRGYEYWPEDRLQERIEVAGTKPDFYVVSQKFGAFLVEVESFERPGPLRGSKRSTRVIASDPEPAFKRIRTAVDHAKKQLRPYKDLGLPMIIILDNWRRVGLPSNVLELRNALFGRLEVRKPIHTSGVALGPFRWHHGKGQKLSGKHGDYISAVAWNLPKKRYEPDPMTEEREMHLRIVHNHFAKSPFPIEIFNNGDDEHYGYNDGKWVKLLGPY